MELFKGVIVDPLWFRRPDGKAAAMLVRPVDLTMVQRIANNICMNPVAITELFVVVIICPEGTQQQTYTTPPSVLWNTLLLIVFQNTNNCADVKEAALDHTLLVLLLLL